jgi:hypothetical protein
MQPQHHRSHEQLLTQRHHRLRCNKHFHGNCAEFVSLNTEGGAHKKLDGIAQGLDIQGEGGIVEYSLRMDCGSEVTLRSHAYWVPELGDTRLLSPQSFNTTDGHRGSAVCHGNRTPEGVIDPNMFAEIVIRLDGPNWQCNTPASVHSKQPYHIIEATIYLSLTSSFQEQHDTSNNS